LPGDLKKQARQRFEHASELGGGSLLDMTPPPAVLRALLTESDTEKIKGFAFSASQSAGSDLFAHYGQLLRAVASFVEGHEIIFLHDVAGGCPFQQACPTLFRKLISGVREASTASGLCAEADFDALAIRCVEFHTYVPGASLVDPNHRDVGSTLTLSALLMQPADGGKFSTVDDSSGRATQHELACGDAIVFCSDTVHNVSPVRSGTRHSLVIELWAKEANWHDRFS